MIARGYFTADNKICGVTSRPDKVYKFSFVWLSPISTNSLEILFSSNCNDNSDPINTGYYGIRDL